MEKSQSTDETKDDAEARNDFFSIGGDFIYRHHVEPQVQLWVPKEETSPFPLKHIDGDPFRTRIWTCCKKAALMIIGMLRWIEVCQPHGHDSRSALYFNRKNYRKDTCGLGCGLQKFKATTRPDHLWPEKKPVMSKAAQRRKSSNALSRNRSSTTLGN